MTKLPANLDIAPTQLIFFPIREILSFLTRKIGHVYHCPLIIRIGHVPKNHFSPIGAPSPVPKDMIDR